MVVVAQLVRASDCGSEGRRFEPGLPPKAKKDFLYEKSFFYCSKVQPKVQILDQVEFPVGSFIFA